MPADRARWPTGLRTRRSRRPRPGAPARSRPALRAVARRPAPAPARAAAGEPGSGPPGTRVPSRHGGRARGSGGLVGGVTERRAQLGEGAGLVEVGPTEALEELQRVAPHRVARGEADPPGRARALAGELLIHLPSREVRHPAVADDHVEVARDGALQCVRAVARHLPRVPPASEL